MGSNRKEDRGMLLSTLKRCEFDPNTWESETRLHTGDRSHKKAIGSQNNMLATVAKTRHIRKIDSLQSAPPSHQG